MEIGSTGHPLKSLELPLLHFEEQWPRNKVKAYYLVPRICCDPVTQLLWLFLPPSPASPITKGKTLFFPHLSGILPLPDEFLSYMDIPALMPTGFCHCVVGTVLGIFVGFSQPDHWRAGAGSPWAGTMSQQPVPITESASRSHQGCDCIVPPSLCHVQFDLLPASPCPYDARSFCTHLLQWNALPFLL